MHATKDSTLDQVRNIYGGAEGALWELLMGQQIHLGGFKSSMDLADRAGLAAGLEGIDLCCCNGAGMRFLVRFRSVRAMTGVEEVPPRICSRVPPWISRRAQASRAPAGGQIQPGDCPR